MFFYELYENEDALAAHSRGEALRAVYPKLAGVMAGGAEMTAAIPKRAKGIDL